MSYFCVIKIINKYVFFPLHLHLRRTWRPIAGDFLLIICIIHAAFVAIAVVADTLYFILILNFNKEIRTTQTANTP